MNVRAIVGVALITLVSVDAHAQVGISARTAGMGNVGVATGRGGEALFYNPALLADTPQTEISVSANAYGYEKLTLEDFFQLSANGQEEVGDFTSTNITVFPSAASTVYPFEAGGYRHALALGLFVPRSTSIESSEVFAPSQYPLAVEDRRDTEETQYWAVLAYGIRLGNFSMGAGPILQFSQFKRTETLSRAEPGPTPTSPTLLFTTQFIDGQALDLRGTFGFAYDLDPFSLGISFLTPTVNLAGSGTFRDSFTNNDSIQGALLSNAAVDNTGASLDQPFTIRAGVGFSPSENLRAALDVSYAMPLNRKLLTFRDVPTSIGPLSDEQLIDDLNSELSVGLGVEYKVTPSVVLRTGFGSVIFSSDPDLVTDAELAQANAALANPANIDDVLDAFDNVGVSTYNYSFTLGGSFLRGASSIDVGLTTIITRGEHISSAQALQPAGFLRDELRVGDVRGYSVFFSVGGTYGVGEAPSSVLPSPQPSPSTDTEEEQS